MKVDVRNVHQIISYMMDIVLVVHCILTIMMHKENVFVIMDILLTKVASVSVVVQATKFMIPILESVNA